MSHRELVKECVRMGSRLDILSDICDTEDVYNVYYEQQKAQRDITIMKRHLDKVKEDLQKALAERNMTFNEKWDIKTLTNFLIKGTENSNQ